MRVALVHDYLNQYGGAERVLEVLCEIFPDAPIYTLLYDESATGGVFKKRDIVTSFLQKLPLASRYHRFLPMFMPLAIEQFNFDDFDLVLSTSASFAKGIITKPSTRHVSYCLTPTRFLWDNSQRYLESFSYPSFIRTLILPFLTYLRIWDQQAVLRVDEFLAISDFVKKRIAKYYHSDASVIYPPVDAYKFSISDTIDDYYLMVGRLVPYKRFDLAIQVFNAIGLPLKIVGDGPELARLKKLAKGNIEFCGPCPDDELAGLYSRTQAVIFPQEEDFGIVPLEAMASGRPVIAYRAGGALETIIEGRTGIFFDYQGEIDLMLAIERYCVTSWDPVFIRQHALGFDRAVFREAVKKVLT